MEFYERGELGGQIDNWWGPSSECLVGMCRSAGFAQVELKDVTNQRAAVVCRRRWPQPDTNIAGPAPQLHSAVNNRTYVSVFHPSKDEYLCCYFKSTEENLTTDSVFIEVDGFGVHALVVAKNEGGYQANCLRPPGLDPGRHEVRIRTRNSALSNAVQFTMLDESGQDISPAQKSLPVEAPELCSVEFRPSGDLRLAAVRGGSLVCYFRSPAQSVEPVDVTIELKGQARTAHTISPLGDGVWQANIMLEEALAEGSSVRIRLTDGDWSVALPALPSI